MASQPRSPAVWYPAAAPVVVSVELVPASMPVEPG
jgi:hypothetical protein